MQSLVCEACWTDVFDTEAIQKFWVQESCDFRYTTTWAQIVQSAQSACNWCAFLESILPSPNTLQWCKNWTTTTDLLVILEKTELKENVSPQGLNHCQIDFCSEGLSRDWHDELELFVDDTDSAGTITARPLQSRVNSAEAFSQIAQWLQNCNKHKNCGGVSLYTNLPSKVIEVAPVGSPGVPRLRSTTGLKGSYLALSYCWGGGQSYVLTTNNIEVLMRELEVKKLPQTILDAIEVTKTLGFKYLWVDALCIMQDSAEAAAQHDMNQELASMDQVYKNATMTIVAACVPSVTDGFLKDRPGSGQGCFDIPCRLGPKHFFAVHIQEHMLYDDYCEPINTRAWAFQEQLLSPRLLLYASHTLQWQCRTLTCNLGGSYHAPKVSAAPRLPSMQNLLLDGPEQRQIRHQVNPDVPHRILQHWLRAVMSYSSRKLSLSSDKLPALSAFAVSYAPILGPEYFAGIWARSAVQQLCWRSEHSRYFFMRPTQYRAPSWSWAALDGHVFFLSFPLAADASVCVPYHRFKIVEWQTRPKAVNFPYGEVTAGKLTIETILRAATFNPSSSPTIRFGAAPSSADTGPIQTADANSDTAEDNYSRPVRCVVMYHRKGPDSPQIGGLILVDSSGHSGLFRRMGTFSADISAFKDYPLDIVTII